MTKQKSKNIVNKLLILLITFLLITTVINALNIEYTIEEENITINITNGTPDYYIYDIHDNETKTLLYTENESYFTINLSPGNYSWLINDSSNLSQEIIFEIGLQEIVVLGCMNETAINYNENATQEDDSCIYALNVTYVVENTTQTENGSIYVNVTGGIKPYHLFNELNVSLSIFNESTNITNLEKGNYSWLINDSSNLSQEIIFEIGLQEIVVLGCMNETAINYNENATQEDESCQYYYEWINESILPGEYSNGVSMTLLEYANNKLFLMGGISSISKTKYLWIYDVETKNWTQGTDMLNIAEGVGITYYENKIYVGPTYEFTKIQIYDIENDSWSYGSDLETDRYDYGMVAINGKIYLIAGGCSSEGWISTNTTFIYDIANDSWSQGADLPVSREGFYGVVGAIAGEHNKVYLAGGVNYNEGEGNPEPTLFIYDLENDSWSQGTQMPQGLAYHGITYTAGYLFALGGWDSEWNVINYVFQYDIQNDSWSTIQSLPVNISETGVAGGNYTIYVAGGVLSNTWEKSNILYKYVLESPLQENNSNESDEQIEIEEPTTPRSSSNSCTTSWICTEWGDCENGLQTRSCTKIFSNCDGGIKPTEIRACVLEPEIQIMPTQEITSEINLIGENTSEKNKNDDSENKIKDKKNESEIKPVLFDIYLETVKKIINTGQKLNIILGLINVGLPGKVDAQVQYQIKNIDGEIVYEEKETVPIETQSEFIKNIDTSNLKEGTYTILVNLEYEGQTEPAQTQTTFTINKKNNYLEIIKEQIKEIAIILITIIITSIIIMLLHFFKHINLPRKND